MSFGARLSALVALGVLLSLVLGTASSGGSSDPTFRSKVATDLGTTIEPDPVYERINSTSAYKIIAHDDGNLSWSFSRTGKSDSGLIYSRGRLVVGSQDNFGPEVGDRIEGELRTEIDLLNSTQKISEDQRQKALVNAVYYSGDVLVDAVTWDSCGNLLAKGGHFDRSLFYYNRSIKADPSIPNPWSNRGVAFRNLGRYKQAVASFSQALNLSPNSSIIWNGKGESLYRLGKRLEALDCFNRSIQLDQSALAWYNKGVILLGLARYSEALDCFNKSISLDPYSAEAWNDKGVAYIKLGRNESSLSCFNHASTLNQKFGGAWANGGMVLHVMGLENKSQDAFSVAKRLGYSRTKDYYLAETLPPALLDETKKSQGLGVAASIILLFFVSLLLLKIRRQGFKLNRELIGRFGLDLAFPVSLVILAESLIFIGYMQAAMVVHALNLTFLILSSAYTTNRLYPALMLLPLFRLLNVAMPVFFQLTLFSYSLVYAPMFIPIYFVLKEGFVTRAEAGLTLKGFWYYTPLAVAVGFALGWGEHNVLHAESLVPGSGVMYIVALSIIMIFFVGTVEEFVFRSVLQTVMEERIGSVAGLLAASVIFGIMHSGYHLPLEVLFVSFAGVVFGLLFWLTRSLPVIALAHGVTNISLFLVAPDYSGLLIYLIGIPGLLFVLSAYLFKIRPRNGDLDRMT